MNFIAEEWRSTYQVILRLFEDKTVNNVSASSKVANKLIQKLHAVRSGFLVPDSLLTNHLGSAREFVAGNATIMKAIGKSRIEPDPDDEHDVVTNLMTMPIEEHHLDATSEAQFRLVPSFLQRNVSKAYELRIVYLNQKLFPFRVFSQELKITSVDWRYGNSFLPFELVSLPQDVSNGVVTFMDRCGLVTGSLDMIVDEGGEHWFLEVNPDGAWMWLDKLVDGIISDSFAEYFHDLSFSGRELGESKSC